MTQTFYYNPAASSPKEGKKLPFVPVSFDGPGGEVTAEALVDSGATINVLPHSLGLAIGGNWDEAPVIPPLAGNLANQTTKALLAKVAVGNFPSVDLVFGWSASDGVPVILGQTNFFTSFDVHFHGRDHTFDIALRN